MAVPKSTNEICRDNLSNPLYIPILVGSICTIIEKSKPCQPFYRLSLETMHTLTDTTQVDWQSFNPLIPRSAFNLPQQLASLLLLLPGILLAFAPRPGSSKILIQTNSKNKYHMPVFPYPHLQFFTQPHACFPRVMRKKIANLMYVVCIYIYFMYRYDIIIS